MLDVSRVNTKITSLFAIVFAAVFVVGLSIMIAPSSYAQEEGLEVVTTEVDEEKTLSPASDEEESEAPTETHYRFVAEKCDSLTKLVRRAILIYDEVNEDIELSKEGIIYTETNIVQDMGAYWLEIGDVVEVPISAIEQYTGSSLDLTVDEVAAWATYVPLVDFKIEDIQQPENVDEVVETLEVSLRDEAPEVVESDDNGTATWWWFAGVGSAAVVWYLLWRKEDN